jgi:hypothetical protein
MSKLLLHISWLPLVALMLVPDCPLWAQQLPNLQGPWICTGHCQKPGQPVFVDQSGDGLRFYNEVGNVSDGKFLDSNTVVATGWQNLIGKINSDGQSINWTNGTSWNRK